MDHRHVHDESRFPAGPLLSILIPTLLSRTIRFERLFGDLQNQIDAGPHSVEILGLLDNKAMSVGAKRNALLGVARGQYLVFIDDDDRVAGDYVSAVCHVLLENPGVDAVAYNVLCTVNGRRQIHCTYSIHNDCVEEQGAEYSAWLPHICVIRSQIGKSVPFPDRNFGEDSEWSRVISLIARTEVRIDRVMYWYDFNSMESETRKNLEDYHEKGGRYRDGRR